MKSKNIILPLLVLSLLLPTVANAYTWIKIDISQQKAYLYRDGSLISSSPVSTGKKGHATRTGNFKVTEKDRDHRSSFYGSFVSKSTGKVIRTGVDSRKSKRPYNSYFRGTPMSYFMRFNGPIGMHSGHLPGYPASHGCVRMPANKAAIFYKYCSVGTKVSVVP